MAAIELKNITYRYPDTNKVLFHDLNLSVANGESMGLSGSNGSGKSTLLRIIATLLKPSGGVVLFDSQKLDDQIGELRKFINFSAGAPLGFYPRLTGIENLILFSAYKGQMISQKEAKTLLARVALSPESMDKKFFQYSLGMRQRLHIARLLLKPNRFILLDEPTNGLDQEGLNLLIDVLNQELKDCTKVLVSHDQDFLNSTTNRILNLQQG